MRKVNVTDRERGRRRRAAHTRAAPSAPRGLAPRVVALAGALAASCARGEAPSRAQGVSERDPATSSAAAPRSAPSPPSEGSAAPAAASARAGSDEVPDAAAAPPAAPADADDVVRWPGRAVVDERPGDRVYAKARFVWIRAAPGSRGAWIGYLSLGDAVRVKGGDAARALVPGTAGGGAGCVAWYAIEPFGYVCTGEDATLDPQDPVVAALRPTAADPTSPWPYRYAESTGTPVYSRVPTEAEQRRTEIDLDRHLAAIARAATGPRAAADPLLGVDVSPATEPPPPFPELPARGRPIVRAVVRGSTLAYTRSFAAHGRSWLLTWDRAVVPKDRVRPYPESHFAGVLLAGARVASPSADAPRLPLGFFRVKARPKYRRGPDGVLAAVPGDEWPRHGWVELGAASVVDGGRRYLETRTPGLYCAEQDVTVVAAPREPPPRVRLGPDAGAAAKWIEVSIDGGWLVAHEGDTPVYATLISPGRGGMPYPGLDPVSTASTPVGQFAVTGKFLTATMISSSDSNIVHAEVQYTQNFSGPHALHGAYWHDAWGEKKSGGCVNLSPVDARRIFAWTDPPLPLGWHGVRADVAGHAGGPDAGRMTVVYIHR
ncbi:MAG: L,D-transpeptidase [Myxococcales bacterium]|nr:L,D-transpeptidase [Myxococcales bacterium]